MAVIDDIKQSKGYLLGAIAFDTTVGAFLTHVLHYPAETTLTAVAFVTIGILFISWLIEKSEKRSEAQLKEHEIEVGKKLKAYDATLETIVSFCKENQLAILRLEMGAAIVRNPENHDTILKYAERYFVDLGGDWVQTDVFFAWIEAENKAGRTVHMPPALMNYIQAKRAQEHPEIKSPL
jgi:hypothetical protein